MYFKIIYGVLYHLKVSKLKFNLYVYKNKNKKLVKG